MLRSERKYGVFADPFLRKAEVFAYVGQNQDLKDLKGVFVVRARTSFVGK